MGEIASTELRAATSMFAPAAKVTKCSSKQASEEEKSKTTGTKP